MLGAPVRGIVQRNFSRGLSTSSMYFSVSSTKSFKICLYSYAHRILLKRITTTFRFRPLTALAAKLWNICLFDIFTKMFDPARGRREPKMCRLPSLVFFFLIIFQVGVAEIQPSIRKRCMPQKGCFPGKGKAPRTKFLGKARSISFELIFKELNLICIGARQ
jgi:hypothetical protein